LKVFFCVYLNYRFGSKQMFIDMIYRGTLLPKADSRVHSNPIASNKSAGTFVGILKIEKT